MVPSLDGTNIVSHGVIKVVVLLLHIITKTHGILDFTCVSNYARIELTGDDDLSITGYFSGDDTNATVNYARGAKTSSFPVGVLPMHSYESTDPKALMMPGAGGVGRVGVFDCVAQKGVVEEKVSVIVMTGAQDVTPADVTKTINVGETTTMSAETVYTYFGWYRNDVNLDGDGVPNWWRVKSNTIYNATVDIDAGIYECYRYNRRGHARHAITQLIVRACVADIWGGNCQYDCPHCYNGGICDERSGECVCPPGFTGVLCETVKGRNHFAQDGQLKCNESDPDACRGQLFCLPHPYGCSCGAGYYGLDCDQDCQSGFYGANCRTECHCADGVTCAPDTGVCAGACHPDWYGVNCQESCPGPEPIDFLSAVPTSSPAELDLSWQASSESNCNETSYAIQYQLLVQDQCQDADESPVEWTGYAFAEGTSLSADATLRGLLPHSTYNISVWTRNTIGPGTAMFVTATTGAGVPTRSPINVEVYNVTLTEISLRWSQPPCTYRHGPITSYSYNLSLNGDVVVSEVVVSSNITIESLSSLTTYVFSISAGNDGDFGPPHTMPITTATTVPSEPRSVAVTNVTKTTLQISWQEPQYLYGNTISKYSIRVKITERPYDTNFIPSDDLEFDLEVADDQRTYTFQDLSPSTKYEIQVSAFSSVGEGDSVVIEQFTDAVTTEDIPKPSSLPAILGTQITAYTVEINIPTTSNVFVSGYQVGVELVTQVTVSEDVSFDLKLSSPSSYFAYVTADLSKAEVTADAKFVVGDGQTYGGYTNHLLHEGYTYILYTGYYSIINSTNPTTSARIQKRELSSKNYVVIWSEGTTVTLPMSTEPSSVITILFPSRPGSHEEDDSAVRRSRCSIGILHCCNGVCGEIQEQEDP